MLRARSPRLDGWSLARGPLGRGWPNSSSGGVRGRAGASGSGAMALEASLECFAPEPEARCDGAAADAEHLGNLGRAHALDLVHHEDRAQIPAEPCEDLVEQLAD